MPTTNSSGRELERPNPAVAEAGAPGDDHDDDPTTVEFKGRIAITDEDAGGDPYNHTGKFRRAIR